MINDAGRKPQVVNVMADGSICEDLSRYQFSGTVPESTVRLFWSFVELGRKCLAEKDEPFEQPGS